MNAVMSEVSGVLEVVDVVEVETPEEGRSSGSYTCRRSATQGITSTRISEVMRQSNDGTPPGNTSG